MNVKTKINEECPVAEGHTPAPAGYIQWHAWAERMAKTHAQMECKGCGRWAIWIPRR